ncbi:MAG: sigma-70 family RNA polymerase sigma factor [Firmicutes bacterium]|jgi:RNA polymerase sigma factor (sigma-70 family)|nr:sigma-70 family RNA polymerase sigma factor [Bacillota bacterium]
MNGTDHVGKEAAQLYDEYGNRLYRIAYGILQNRADAEDAVQDVFVKIMGKRDAMPKCTEQIWPWLARVMVNQCKDMLRKQKIRAYTPIEEALEIIEGKEEAAMAQKGDVLTILLALPEKYKLPMVLHYLEGFSVDEVGRILGVGRSAVKMRLSRGRQMVKKQMEEGTEVGR